MALPGICGPSNRPCKISHSSTYPNQVGVYPSDFLPSTSTIWHAVFVSHFPLTIPTVNVVSLGTTSLISGGSLGLLGPLLTPTIGNTHTFQSHHYIIFARTVNRLNIPHILTEEEISSIGQEGRPPGIGVINVGEYIFEAVAATDQIEAINTTLTPELI